MGSKAGAGMKVDPFDAAGLRPDETALRDEGSRTKARGRIFRLSFSVRSPAAKCPRGPSQFPLREAEVNTHVRHKPKQHPRSTGIPGLRQKKGSGPSR